MYDEIPRTSKRMNEIESTAADRFDATILHNRVYEALGQDSRVRQLVDVAERAYQLEEYKEGYTDEVRRAAFGAAEDLNDQIDGVVEARIAAECAALIKDTRNGWFDEDHLDESTVRDAFGEACAWLVEHPQAADAAGVEVREVIRGADDGAAESFDPADYDNVREALQEAPGGYGAERVLDHFDPVVDEEVTPDE